METISRPALAKSLAETLGLSLGRAKLLLSLAAAELELADAKRFSLRTAGELELIVSRKASR